MNSLVNNNDANVYIEKKRYMPGLDGLRALSILAVIAYHLNFPWASGGFLGVGIFFTLSGYLITDQLMMEWNKTGKISLKNFWIRRIRRIIPAMLLLLATLFLWLILLAPSRIDSLKGDFISTLLYYNNWWKIFHNVSYFEHFGPQSPIGHLWSLAIEEQFYILWPVILMIGLHFTPKRSKLAAFVLVGALASILAMEFIYEPGTDPSRVYYGTDTRAFALLIGAVFAILFPSHNLSEQISLKRRVAIDIMGSLGLTGTLFMIWKTNEYQSSLYVYGLVFLSIISAYVTVILAHPASCVAKFMGCKPLKWIGVRSYSLYLWHYPVIILTTPTVDTGEFDVIRIVLQLALILLLADFSWKYIETPIRRIEFGQFRNNAPFLVSSIVGKSLFFIVIALSSFYVTYYSTTLKREISSVTALSAVDKQVQADISEAYNDMLPPLAVDSEEHFSDTSEQPADEQSPSTHSVDGYSNSEQPSVDNSTVNLPIIKAGTGKGILVIGDSIIINAVPYLEELLPGIIVDGKVSRQMSQAQEVIDQYTAGNKIERIIIELGTNGPFSTKQLRQLLTSLGDMQQIILVNTRVPRNWQDIVNSDMEKIASEFSNTSIADWFSASKGKDSFFYDDGVHLKPEGASYYASIIAKAVQ